MLSEQNVLEAQGQPAEVCIILEMGLGGGICTNWSDLPQLPSSV